MFGCPEISYFYTQVFLQKINNSAIYQGITFDIDWALEVTAYNAEAYPNQVKAESALLHLGNLQWIFK